MGSLEINENQPELSRLSIRLLDWVLLNLMEESRWTFSAFLLVERPRSSSLWTAGACTGSTDGCGGLCGLDGTVAGTDFGLTNCGAIGTCVVPGVVVCGEWINWGCWIGFDVRFGAEFGVGFAVGFGVGFGGGAVLIFEIFGVDWIPLINPPLENELDFTEFTEFPELIESFGELTRFGVEATLWIGLGPKLAKFCAADGTVVGDVTTVAPFNGDVGWIFVGDLCWVACWVDPAVNDVDRVRPFCWFWNFWFSRSALFWDSMKVV